MDTDQEVLRRIHGVNHRAEISADLPMRSWVYAWLFDPHREGNHQRAMDRWIGLLIVANLFALLFEHVPAVYEPHAHWFHFFDVVSVIIFTAEYLLRLYVAPEDPEFAKGRHPHLAYVRSPFAIIDLLAILPFYLQAFLPVDLRVLRFLRLLRILKLFRVLIPAWHEFVAANRGRTFRQKVHALVWPTDHGGKLHEYFDTFIVVWVVISVIAVILESVESIHFILNLEFIILDSVAVAIFTTEYLLRIYSVVEEPGMKGAFAGRLRFARSGSALVDLLAILPFFLEALLHHLLDLRFLRVFRMMRLLKLSRYTGATKTLGIVMKREWPVLMASAFIMLLLVVLTASLGYLFEHEAQPDKFENIPQSIYWAVVTLASVKEREALKANLFSMLKDGEIDPSEADVIREEAKRLHLTVAEVNALIELIIKENSIEDGALPLHKIAEKPELAMEHYKSLLGQIRQLGLLTDAQRFDSVAQQGQRLSEQDYALWKQIQGHS